MNNPNLNLESIKKILVRGPNWIGDAVMCTPALAALRRAFPEAEISLLVNGTVGELLTENSDIDRIWVYDKKGKHRGLIGKFRLVREMAGESFDLAVLFQNAFEAALLAALAGIPHRCGYAKDGRWPLLSLRSPWPSGNYHQVDFYMRLLEPLGVRPGERTLRLRSTDAEQAQLRKKLRLHGIAEDARIVGINPGATYGPAKQWPIGRYAEMADRLIARQGVSVIIFGGPGEEWLGQAISGCMRENAWVLSGRLTVRELIAAIKQCALFITNDSGPMHIAAALGTPLIAVFGPTNPEVTSPVGDRVVLLRKEVECSPCLLRTCPIDHRCMMGISVEEVYAAAERQLNYPSCQVKLGEPVHGI